MSSIRAIVVDPSVTWEIPGKRWALLVLKNLSTKEVIRFNEPKRLLPGISSTVMSERLLELDREGLISKQIYPEIPPRVEFLRSVHESLKQ